MQAKLQTGTLLVVIGLLTAQSLIAQLIVPRRWTHMPNDLNAFGFGYVYSQTDLHFQPAFQLEDVELERHNAIAHYLRTFDMLNKSCRFEVLQGYQRLEWDQTFAGQRSQGSQEGLKDTMLRLGINFYGPPPQDRQSYMDYLQHCDEETILGAGISIEVPTGAYDDSERFNIGSNRFTFRPQIGGAYRRGKWSCEFSGEVWLFTDNDDYNGGNELESAAFYAARGRVIYTQGPGAWVSLGLSYGEGQESTLNGMDLDDEKEILSWSVTCAYSLSKQFGLRFLYQGSAAQSESGPDSHTLAFGAAYLW